MISESVTLLGPDNPAEVPESIERPNQPVITQSGIPWLKSF